MAIKVKTKGNFNNTKQFLTKNANNKFNKILEAYGRAGCEALAAATPEDTGATKESWAYTISQDGKNTYLSWHNTNVTSRGTPVVILLRYGHGTKNGGYVQGYDFINPTIRPIFDGFTDAVWKEVTTS